MELIVFTEHVEKTVEETLEILQDAFSKADDHLRSRDYHYGISYAVEKEVKKHFKTLLMDELRSKIEAIGANLTEVNTDA